MNYYQQECLEKFENLPAIDQEAFKNEKAVEQIKGIENKYQIDIEFLVTLIAIEELDPEDIEEYLQKKYKFDASKAREIGKELNEKIIQPAFEMIKNENISDEEFDLDRESRRLLEVFKNNLLDIFSETDKEQIDFVNKLIITSLYQNQTYKTELLEALYANQELISTSEINLAGVDKPSTVGNWVADFVKHSGSEMFETLVISDYIANSPNGKKLSETERDLLDKVLRVYRNIKFCPEVFAGIDPENWEIIPTIKSETLTKIGKADEIFKKRSEVFSVPSSIKNEVILENKKSEITENQSVKVETKAQKLVGKIQNLEIQNNPILINSKIGANQIQIADKLVEQSLKNWLASYQIFIGMPAGNLSARMSYLNNSADAKKLSMLDKERLSLVLKSHDEGIELEFNLGADGSFDVSLPKREVKLEDLSVADSYILTAKNTPVQPIKPEIKTEIKPVEPKRNIEKQIDFSKDNQEIEALGKKVAEKDDKIEAENLAKVEQIVKLTGKKFDNKDLAERFRNIVLTRVKGIRNKIQVKETFTKAVESGGLGMRADSAEYIVDKMEVFLTGEVTRQSDKKIIASPKIEPVLPTPKIVSKDEPIRLADTEARSEIEKIEDLLKNLSPEKEPETKAEEKSAKTTDFMSLSAPTAVNNLSRSDKSGKITDVVLKTKPVGPIEELRALDLENFKRFEGSAMDRVTKIAKRIAVLESESLIKKSEGIKAWKQSEVYRLYQEMGQESLLSGSKVSEIITQRQQAKKPYLTQEEFDAIGNLNKSLRF